MTDDPALTSSWCTNWAAFNTPRLWAMVSDEDNPDAWRQVAAWADVAAAVKDQRARLVQARDSLTAAWPPEQNGSAQAFVNELDSLINRMGAAQQEADTTATGLANILEALRTAKTEIQPLYEEYRSKSDDWIPNWWDHAEEEIDRKAQAAMITAEQVVQQNVPQLKVPDPYTLDPKGARVDFAGTDHRSGGPGTAAGIRVPHHPVPPMPGYAATVPTDAVPSAPDASLVGQTGGANVGPGLAGVIAPPPPAAGVPPGSSVVIPAGGGVPAGAGPVPGIPLIPPPVPAVLPGGGAAGGAAVPGIGGIGGGVARGGRPVRGVAGRALPSGAVIGETVGGVRGGGIITPEIGGMAGRGAADGRSAGRAGRGAADGRSAGRAGRRGTKPKPPSWLPEDESHGYANEPAGGIASGRRAGRRDGVAGGHYDPDCPWEVAVGVETVITSSDRIQLHDPGPNVIGWRG